MSLESPTSGTGIGLQNIRDRLAMLYPGKGRLTLTGNDAADLLSRKSILTISATRVALLASSSGRPVSLSRSSASAGDLSRPRRFSSTSA